MKPLDKGSVRNYAKCGPYDKEPRCSAVKVVPEVSGKWGCRAARLEAKAGRGREANRHVHLHSSPGVAGAARMKERRRNVGGPVRSCIPQVRKDIRLKAEVLSEAVQGVGEVVVAMRARTTKPCRSEGPSVSLCSCLRGKTFMIPRKGST
jgi:molybdopterin/thiamine biosynthesis adenylyltransferase